MNKHKAIIIVGIAGIISMFLIIGNVIPSLDKGNYFQEDTTIQKSSECKKHVYGMSGIQPFIYSLDYLLYDTPDLKMGSLNVRNTRASVFFESTVSTMCKNMKLSLIFYNSSKEEIDRAMVCCDYFIPSEYHEIKFDFPKETAYLQVDSFEFTECQQSEITYYSDVVPLGDSIHASGFKIKTSMEGNNHLELKGKNKSGKTAYVFIYDSNKEVIEILEFKNKSIRFKDFIDYGGCYFRVIIA